MKKLLLFIIILTTFISCEEYSEPICGEVIEVESVIRERKMYWKYTFKKENSNKKYYTWRSMEDGKCIPVGSRICFGGGASGGGGAGGRF